MDVCSRTPDRPWMSQTPNINRHEEIELNRGSREAFDRFVMG